MSMHGRFCWNELCTTDLNGAKEFYSQVFGWQFKDLKVDGMIYTIIKYNEEEIAGIWQIPENKVGTMPPHWMSYVAVEDIEESLKKAKEHGGQQIKEVTKIGDMGKFAIIHDPSGAHFALWQSLK